MASPKRHSPGESVASYRKRMRSLGLKPVVIWVPDVDAPGFADEARRQSRLIAESDDEDDLAFIDSLAEDLFNDLDTEGL